MKRYRNICVNGRSLSEHRHVMELHLGHPIPAGLVVHHRNGDRLDNRLTNLELMTHQQHSEHHNQKHPKVLICEVCGGVFEPHPTKRARQKTCSSTCRWRATSRTRLEKLGGVRTEPDGRVTRPCTRCGVRLPWTTEHFGRTRRRRP